MEKKYRAFKIHRSPHGGEEKWIGFMSQTEGFPPT